MTVHFISKTIPPAMIETPALWFIYCENQLLLYKEKNEQSIPEVQTINTLNLNAPLLSQHYLGLWQHKHCFCAEISSLENLPGYLMGQPLRQAALEGLSQPLFHLAARAYQILQWDKSHQFCSRCGAPLHLSQTERAKVCPQCHLLYYPRISPCVIMLVKRGREILLARSPHFTPGVYSALAGFVEPGESAEEAVMREVDEETGIKIKNLRYRFSQPWPFSESLMLGFTAEYLAGEIIIDGSEIEDAGWFTIENLPSLPSSISLANRLIELFIHKEF